MLARSTLPVLTLAALSMSAGCGGTDFVGPSGSRWTDTNSGMSNAISGSPAERFFPLVDGMVYSYDTETELADRGFLVARVHRTDLTHGELLFPNGQKRFLLGPQGVTLEGRAGETTFVLKLPIAVGTSWRGEHGGQARITSVNDSVDVTAGHYDGCVRTMEERGGDKPVRYSTLFCPEVGVVELEASTGANFERATLKSYAQPPRLREEGRDKIPVNVPFVPVQ